MDKSNSDIWRSLSDREYEVITLASQGKTDKEIAAALGISLSTVTSYWTRVRDKMGVSSRSEAVAIVARSQGGADADQLRQEINRRVEAERALAQSQRMLDSLSVALPVAVLHVDGEGRIAHVFGRPLAEWMDFPNWPGHSVFEVFRACPSLVDGFTRALNGERIGIDCGHDNRHFRAEYRPALDEEGAVSGAVALISDITDQVNELKEFRERAMLFYTAAERAPLLAWLLDAEGNFEFANAEFRRFIGDDTVEGKCLPLQERVHPEDRELYQVKLAATERQQPYRTVERVRSWDGSYRWILSIGFPRTMVEGKPRGYVGFGLDITEQMAELVHLRERVRELTQEVETLRAFSGLATRAEELLDRLQSAVDPAAARVAVHAFLEDTKSTGT